MSTKIYSCNIIIGDNIKQAIVEKTACKKLPVHILTSQNHFIKSLQLKLGKDMMTGIKIWDKLPKNKITGMPNIKIVYLKYLGDVAQEVTLPYF